MRLDRQEKTSAVIVRVAERVDGVTAPDFEQYLGTVIEESDTSVILDFSGLTYISSAGLRVVLSSAKKLKEKGRQLLFTGLVGPVEQVFKLSGFYALFTVFATVDQAYAHISGKG